MRIQGRGVRVPEPFWPRVAQTFASIGERRAISDLRGDMARLLADYERRNGDYRFRELFLPAASASIAAGEDVGWLAELARTTSSPEMLLYDLLRTPGLTGPQRVALRRQIVPVVEKSEQGAFGDERLSMASRTVQARLGLISTLIAERDWDGAAAEWRLLPPAAPAHNRWERDSLRDTVEMQLAVRAGTLPALLERFRLEGDAGPAADSLRQVAMSLRQNGNGPAALELLGFVYDRELRNGRLEAANFLGLAEVKLQSGDAQAALALLNRMWLVLPDGFDTLTRSAELLAQHGRRPDAVSFLQRRIQAVPWDAEAKAQLAALLPVGAERDRLFAAVVQDGQTPYAIRANAARQAGAKSGATAGTELALLSAATIPPSDASRPFQVEARVAAASAASDPAVAMRLWREAVALAPADARARLGLIRAALAARKDELALAVYRAMPQVTASGAPIVIEKSAELAESLAAAAERLDDLAAAEQFLRLSIALRPAEREASLQRRVDALVAEQRRHAQNAARMPAIRNVIEQDHVVLPMLPRNAQ